MIYESFLTSAYKISADSNVTFSTELNNSTTTTGNTISTNNEPAENNNSSILLFAENKFWFQEKMTNYSKDIIHHSETTNKTKRILCWNKNFGGGLR